MNAKKCKGELKKSWKSLPGWFRSRLDSRGSQDDKVRFQVTSVVKDVDLLLEQLVDQRVRRHVVHYNSCIWMFT